MTFRVGCVGVAGEAGIVGGGSWAAQGRLVRRLGERGASVVEVYGAQATDGCQADEYEDNAADEQQLAPSHFALERVGPRSRFSRGTVSFFQLSFTRR